MADKGREDADGSQPAIVFVEKSNQDIADGVGEVAQFFADAEDLDESEEDGTRHPLEDPRMVAISAEGRAKWQ